ncbi:CPCC family cysteine-rich protein [Streptococcus pluranimalium]|uniref:CPCC family cysteine-rich protein n=1 Tax=Streptococcus pluranimalium TaxID=82348 RepID=UPI003F66EDA1
MKKYKCPCCGYYTLREVGSDTYEICRVCYWEYDLLSLQYPDEASGANAISLN